MVNKSTRSNFDKALLVGYIEHLYDIFGDTKMVAPRIEKQIKNIDRKYLIFHTKINIFEQYRIQINGKFLISLWSRKKQLKIRHEKNNFKNFLDNTLKEKDYGEYFINELLLMMPMENFFPIGATLSPKVISTISYPWIRIDYWAKNNLIKKYTPEYRFQQKYDADILLLELTES